MFGRGGKLDYDEWMEKWEKGTNMTKEGEER